jgi:Ion transport protein
MELYAFKLPPTNDEILFNYYHEPNFDTFLHAFVSVFIVLANDGWFRLYMNHYRATDNPLGSSFYFFSLLIFGQFILLNLFISVLINNFEETSVKNDLVTRLTNLKKDSVWKKVKMWVKSKLQMSP